MRCRNGGRGERGENRIKGLVEKVRTSGSVGVDEVGVVVVGVIIVIIVVVSVSSSRVAVVIVVVIWECYVTVFCFLVYFVDDVFIVWVKC